MSGMTGATSRGGEGYNSGRSPIGLGGAIAVHGAVLGLFLLMPKEMIDVIIPTSIRTINIPIPPPPDPIIEKDPPKPVETQITTVKPIVPTETKDTVILPPPPPFDPIAPTGAGKEIIIAPPPPPDPVLTDAIVDKRYLAAFQPSYPDAMVRAQTEGSVTVRVTIGADGRVSDIEKVSASNEAFWLATMRHAMKQWRFKPATRDGVAVTSTKVMTVHFKLA
jgi:protein TonB